MVRTLLLSLGAVLGANTRFWLGVWASNQWGADFPYGTFLVNVTGCFLIGLFNGLGETRFVISPELRLFFAVGFLGAYTTFSSFGYESINLLRAGNYWLGALNVFGSLLLGLAGVILGLTVGRMLG